MHPIIYIGIALPILSLVLFFIIAAIKEPDVLFRTSKQVREVSVITFIQALRIGMFSLFELKNWKKRTALYYLGLFGIIGTTLIIIFLSVYIFAVLFDL